MRSWSRDGKDVITGYSISVWIPWIHFWIRCFKASILAGCILCNFLLTWPRRQYYGTARSGKHHVHQKHVTILGIWKTACLLGGASILTVIVHNDASSNCSRSINFRASSWDSISRHTQFSLLGHHLACPVAWSYSNRPLPLELCQGQGTQGASCQCWWLTTVGSGVYSRDPLSFLTARVYWMTW